jgi:hypothetical protein
MGTAVVATAGVALPLRVPGLRTACAAVWALSLALLIVLLRAPGPALEAPPRPGPRPPPRPGHAPFYGCLAMALMAVGGGAVTVGRDWIGTEAAVALDAVLSTAGTVVGLGAAVAVPYLMAVRHRIGPGQATPVVLVAAWGTAAVHTVRGLVSGELLAAPRPAPAAPRPATVRTTSGAVR